MSTDEQLRGAGLDPAAIATLVRAALAEDLGEAGDLTSLSTVPADVVTTVRYVARAPGVAAGLPVLAAIAEVGIGAAASFEPRVADGARLDPGQPLADLTAPARDVLALERTSLNLLGHLCGVATTTRAWVDAVAGTRAQIRDTRKTLPLLRALDKYAVRCGGGVNHRAGLHDAVLIKDNHVAAAGGVGPALDAVLRRYGPGSPGGQGRVVVQVEVDDLDQLDEALDHGAPQVLLDNFDLDALSEAVGRVRSMAPQVLLEASGGLTLNRAAAVAATGVDFLAVGALTHSAPALDIGLDTVSVL
ncbi:MAG TPA: carboxylating nicotinate-nucleotide diphosphorylase [Nocardioidaceae bacterium]|nr:carboxylating nicotinate-nucleotide diphosphorylase [Nocardioidaceae bacterium]